MSFINLHILHPLKASYVYGYDHIEELVKVLGRCFFCGSFMLLFCLVFAMHLFASVYMCFVVTCWERADLLALVCGVYL